MFFICPNTLSRSTHTSNLQSVSFFNANFSFVFLYILRVKPNLLEKNREGEESVYPNSPQKKMGQKEGLKVNVIPFPEYIPILEEYRKELSNKDDSTIDAYMRILRQFTEAHRRKRVDPEKSCTGDCDTSTTANGSPDVIS
ncbi:hypothetical protein [Paenibacillus larvae]|uniref:hypothetical protein n=1 Tax=Paenibacillus larvae TaxID=1464 RepID=UPI0013142FC2|nr:hypothetical protein [Paenibacillus larvae]